MAPKLSWKSKTAATLLLILAILGIIFLAGLYLPLSALTSASATLAIFISWLSLAVLLATVLGVLLWRFRRSRLTALTASLLALSLAGHLGIIGAQWITAAKEGYAIKLTQLLTISDTGAPDRVETYTTFDGIDQSLNIWEPKNSNGNAPMIFWTHGGGWVQGDADVVFGARWLADQGYIVVSAEYPLSTATKHYWDVTEDRLAAALAWVRDHADELGGDINKLAAAGDSAGGNLAINLAYRANQGTLRGIEGEIPQFKAVTTVYPAAYPTLMYSDPDPLKGAYSRGAVEEYVGGSPEEFPDRYRAISAESHIGENTPPTLAVAGQLDGFVPHESSVRLTEKLSDAGVKNRLVLIPFADHVFDTAAGGVAGQTWRQAQLQWLKDNGVE